MTSVLYNNHSQAIAKQLSQQHLKNMIASLDHRIAVARANQDSRLMELLLQEKRQLESWSGDWAITPKNLIQKFRFLWQQIGRAIANGEALHVEKIVEASGEVWWYAHDPRTGKTLWAESEPEVVKWIEDNNLGR